MPIRIGALGLHEDLTTVQDITQSIVCMTYAIALLV